MNETDDDDEDDDAAELLQIVWWQKTGVNRIRGWGKGGDNERMVLFGV